MHALNEGRSTGGADTLSSSKVVRQEITRMSKIVALIIVDWISIYYIYKY